MASSVNRIEIQLSLSRSFIAKRAGALCSLFLCAILSACGGSSSSSILSDGPGNELPVDATPESATVDATGCAERIDGGRVSVPVVMVNSARDCDYFLTGSVQFLASVTIEPGTSIVMGQGASIRFVGGPLTAVGTPDQRISIRGESPLQGFWGAVTLFEMRPSRMEYLDISDAGDTVLRADGALQIVLSTTSLVDVSISNSRNVGLNLMGSAQLTAFSNNRFYGNVDEGIRLRTQLVPMLDAESDYRGINAPNGKPVITVNGGEPLIDARWKALNAPYAIQFLSIGQGEELTLAAGTQVEFNGWGSSNNLLIYNGGKLNMTGTADAPIMLGQSSTDSAPWHTIEVSAGTLKLDHVRILGGTNGLTIKRDGSRVSLSNTNLTGNSEWGIRCRAGTLNGQLPAQVLTYGSGLVFSSNSQGDISPECPDR